MIELAVDVLSWALMLAGGFFCITGGIGLVRMPELYTRMHAASIMDTLGAGLLIFGMMLQAGFTLTSVRLAIILVFFLMVSPIATHALARAAMHAGIRPLLHRKTEKPPSNS
ncbi:MAG: monovalent cation/H(+) antiporter subunit G [Rhodospirillales bacterium]